MADDPSSQPMRADEAPTEVDALNAWLDAQLGRPLALVTLRRSGGRGDDILAEWRAQLSAFPLVTLAEEVADDASLAEALTRIAQRDPDALLICDDVGEGVSSDDADSVSRWRGAMLDIAEGRNLFERMQIVLVGAGMTRKAARAKGFEDGFASDQPLVETLAILAREAVTRAAYRRYGSSPPCYL